jgi:WD40 repeat protein/transcriptional regulator with XRE-family HTH domain
MQHYQARDHGFGTRLLALRMRAGLSQQEVAARLGVSERAVRAWEAGASYPDPTNLQGLLASYLQQGAFPTGQEEAEARALWEQVRQHSVRFKLPFDQAWFASLLATRTPDATPGAREAPAPTAPAADTERDAPAAPGAVAPRQDWGEAPDLGSFHGRAQELATLTSWTLSDRCRVVALLGLGGIGKTALAARLAQDLASQFACLFWRSLRNALPFEEWLRGAAGFLSDQQQTTLPESLDARLAVLLDLLRAQRCLLVLDNWETVLAPGAPELGYRTGYEGYGTLLRRLGEARHESLLLLTSREQPPELGLLAGAQAAVRVLQVGRLGEAESQALLQDRGLSGGSTSWGVLVERYGGNPLALRLVGATIADLFDGDISAFLAEGATVTGGIRRLLEEQVGRLSPLEQELLTWLSIEREPIGFGDLVGDLGPGVARAQVVEAVAALRHRSLLEPVVAASFPTTSVGGAGGSWTLQPVVLEYVTDRLGMAVAAEIADAQPTLLVSHALLKATAKDYVRHSQERLIAQPLLERLRATGGSAAAERRLVELLEAWRGRPAGDQGYGPGNVVNLLRLARGDLRGLDLSHLSLRQAYLAEVEAQDASLAGAHLAEAVLGEAFDYPTSVALSANGAYLAAGTSTGEVRLWRVADRALLLAVPGHSGMVLGVALSGDGRLLASGSFDGMVKLWEVPSGRLMATMSGHSGRVWGVALSADGRLVASGSLDGTVRLWTAPSGNLTATLQSHTGEVSDVALSEDGHILAGGSFEGTVRLWAAPSGQLLATLQGHGGPVNRVALSQDGQLVASGGVDGTVRLWEASSGRGRATLQAHRGAVRGVALSGDGWLLASGGWDGTLKLWEAASGRLLATVQGHGDMVYDVAISRDGRLVASASEDETVKLWEALPGDPRAGASSAGRLVATLKGHTSAVTSVALSADGRLAACGSYDGTIRLWGTGSGRLLATLRGHRGAVWGVALSADGRLVASGSQDTTVRLWEAPSGRLLAILEGHTGGIRDVALSADGHIVASASEDATANLWLTPLAGSLTGDESVGVGQPDRLLATLQGDSIAVRAVALSADGRLVATGSEDWTAKLWEAPSGRLLATLRGHTGGVRHMAFSGDGRLVVTGSFDETARLWEAPSGRLLATVQGHTDSVNGVALSADGGLMATGGADGMVKLWEVSHGDQGQESGDPAPNPEGARPGRVGAMDRPLATLQGHTGLVVGVALSGDGGLLASGSIDGTVRLWETGTGICLRTLRVERRYERLDITGLTGVTEAQRTALLALGAVERRT